jgi:calcineurin-like phosphoesterase family protein
MYNPLKLKHTPESRVFFTSDTHFGHNRDFVYAARGFKDVQEHDRELVRIWNETVSPDDIVVHLGDFTVGAGPHSEEFTRNKINQLNGTIYFVWGNHNAGMKGIYLDEMKSQGYSSDIAVYPLRALNNKLCFIGQTAVIRIGSQLIHVSHYAHHIWYESHHGSWLLSGHSHGSDKTSLPESTDFLRMDMGWDVHKKPKAFDEIQRIMNKKKIKIIDHHGASTT